MKNKNLNHLILEIMRDDSVQLFFEPDLEFAHSTILVLSRISLEQDLQENDSSIASSNWYKHLIRCNPDELRYKPCCEIRVTAKPITETINTNPQTTACTGGNMFLKLHHVPGLRIVRGYHQPPVDPQQITVFVESAINASQVYRQWVERNHLEPGNLAMASGLLYTSEECKNPVARVWDNGNVFSMAGEKLYDEGEQS